MIGAAVVPEFDAAGAIWIAPAALASLGALGALWWRLGAPPATANPGLAGIVGLQRGAGSDDS